MYCVSKGTVFKNVIMQIKLFSTTQWTSHGSAILDKLEALTKILNTLNFLIFNFFKQQLMQTEMHLLKLTENNKYIKIQQNTTNNAKDILYYHSII